MENEFQFRSLEATKEVIFSWKRNKSHHPDITFYSNPVKKKKKTVTKIFMNVSYSKLDFNEHIKRVYDKTSKYIGLIRTLRNFLPRPSHLQIYKSFVRPYQD